MPQDNVEAVRWFRKAADQEEEEAQFYLGQAYLNGLGVDKDDGVAFMWFSRSAEQDYPEAQLPLDAVLLRARGSSGFGPRPNLARPGECG